MTSKNPDFLIQSNCRLRDCMEQIGANKRGFVFLTDPQCQALGLLTDGDIRRALLSGASLDEAAIGYMKSDFRRVQVDTPRDKLLKFFDSSVKFVPEMIGGKISRIITLDELRYHDREVFFARAKAPARISFSGGGTDLTTFFVQHKGAVLNATIDMFARATITRRNDRKIVLISNDYNQTVECDGLANMAYDGKLDLLKAAIKLLSPPFGFELEVSSDFPPSSGLGGSSVVLAAVISCFNEFRSDKLNPYAIAEMAFQAERIELSCPGGWQDQYASVFGGFNLMEFREDRNEMNPLRIPENVQNELEERLVLCFTGSPHPTHSVHLEQKSKMVEESSVTDQAHKARDLAYEMKYALMRGNLDHFGEMLHEAWIIKRKFANSITNQKIDEIYELARANGAVGGKILGAGGGGYFLFQAAPNKKFLLSSSLSMAGYKTTSFKFEDRGVRSWTVG